MSAYGMPKFKISEIIRSLKDVGIILSDADFERPDPRRWMDIYSRIFYVLTSKNIDDSFQVFNQYASIKVQYKDLYDEGLNQMGFTLCMQRVFVSCGILDFCVQDIVDPGRKRLIKLLTAFVNKVRCDNTEQNRFEDIKYGFMQSKDEYEQVINLNAKLKHQWEKMKQTEEKIEQQMTKLTEECETQLAQMGECHRQKEPEQRIIEDFKLNISEKNALKERYKSERTQIKQEVDKLSQKIVQSPEKFKQEHDRLKKKVVELNNSFDLKLNKKSMAKAVTEQTLNNKTAAEKASRLAKEVMSDLEKAKEILTEMEQCNEKLQEFQYEMTTLCTECDDVNENFAIRQGQKHTLAHQSDLRKQCSQQHKEDLERNLAMYQEKLDSITCQEAQVGKKIADCKESAQRFDDQFDKISKAWRSELEGIYQEMDILHNNIANGCKRFKEAYEE